MELKGGANRCDIQERADHPESRYILILPLKTEHSRSTELIAEAREPHQFRNWATDFKATRAQTGMKRHGLTATSTMKASEIIL